MNKFTLIGASIAALVAVPVIAQHTDATAQHAMKMHHAGKEPMTRAEVEAMIAKHFAEFDASKDGSVTRAEFDAAIEAKRAEMQKKMETKHAEMFGSLDTDKNGQISRAEWDAHHAAMKQKHAEKRESHGTDGKSGEKHAMAMHHGAGGMRMHGEMGDRWFDTADANKNGSVTLAEAKASALARFDKVDTNKDGTITPEERKAAHKAMRTEWSSKRSG